MSHDAPEPTPAAAAGSPAATSRRTFLKLGVSAGALVLSWRWDGVAEAAPTGWAPNAWLSLSPQGDVTFTCARVEMGQGVYHALTLLVAEELRLAPDAIKVAFAPAAPAYKNPDLGLQVTGGSSSVRTSYATLRDAASVMRRMLLQAAAQEWGLREEDVLADGGVVRARAGDRSAPYAALLDRAAKLPVPKPQWVPPAEQRWIGKEGTRVDAPLKVTGQAAFGIDQTHPEALVAVVIRPPEFGATVDRFDASRALAQPGIVKAFAIPSGVALLGKSYWRLRKARELVDVTWKSGPLADFSSARMRETMKELAAHGKNVRDDGKDETLTGATLLDVEYDLPYLAHAPMEPQNCLAHVEADRCTVWAPTQAPGIAQERIVALTGLSHDQVHVHTTFLGGGFGRRLSQDFVEEAVLISREARVPVKLVWSREDDIRHGLFRPMTYHRLRGAVKDGRIVSWRHDLAGQSIMSQILPSWLPAMLPAWVPQALKRTGGSVAQKAVSWLGSDDTAVEGAKDMPYQSPRVSVNYAMAKSGPPVGFWRSVGHSYTGFVVESFVDELAHAAGQDPIAFRLAHLPKDHVLAKLLATVADASQWHSPAPAGAFRGVACHSSFQSHAAHVVEITRRDDGNWRVSRVWSAVECGMAVDPDGVRAQVESAVVFGLTAALHGEITFEKGAVTQSNFDDYPLMRADACPAISVTILPSQDPPRGMGEPGLPPVAPALANAFFRATGQRLRRMPLNLTSGA